MIKKLFLLFCLVSCVQPEVKPEESPEHKNCRMMYEAAEKQVKRCLGLCAYGSYCCPFNMCSTTDIEIWNKNREKCLGEGFSASEILWPKENTGKEAPECFATENN